MGTLSLVFGIILIIAAIVFSIPLMMVFPFPYAGIIIIVLIIIGALLIRKYDKDKKKPKPLCEFCGYMPLDERDLHNHQITCEKKKSKEKNS